MIPLLLAVAMACWAFGYLEHRLATEPQTAGKAAPEPPFAAPVWLIVFAGMPRADSLLTAQGLILQTMAYLSLLGQVLLTPPVVAWPPAAQLAHWLYAVALRLLPGGNAAQYYPQIIEFGWLTLVMIAILIINLTRSAIVELRHWSSGGEA